MKLSKRAEAFVRRFERTKGFGRRWSLEEGETSQTTGSLGVLRTPLLNHHRFHQQSCPLTAPFDMNCGEYRAAAKRLRISRQDALKIAQAADGEMHSILRRRLLAAVGLA